MKRFSCLPMLCLALSVSGWASSGNPQVKTDHPWYPGELAFSTFERLFKTEAELYRRITGRDVESDEDKALAAWYWRNLHYAHGEEGKGDYFNKGLGKGGWNREYWLGLFAEGFALCGTTHAQWTAEMQRLLGPCRGRVVGVSGHNSFEVFLTGGAYGKGRWALLDHDISTVIFAKDGSRLLSIQEIKQDLKTLENPRFKPERQRGWLVAGLHPKDAGVYKSYRVAEYLAGYAAVPPMVHLRPGERLRRYLKPGLEDGQTFVFWGRNYKAKGIPGPERSRTWVNQPRKMYRSTKGSRWIPGQVRFANAVYTYAPDFKKGTYREGVLDESAKHVSFEFYTPYVIGCTPPNDKAWGIYDSGGKNGLLVKGQAACHVKVSTDQGKTWFDGGPLNGALDLTDRVKGRQQYFLRFEAGAQDLAGKGITIRTVCQCNVAVIPRLKAGGSQVTYWSSGTAYLSAGPNKNQAAAHIVEGAFGSPEVTLELAAPRKEKAVRLYAAGWEASGAPPSPKVKYQIEYSSDKGQTWKPVVKDWRVERRGPEPGDFWSQSFSYGNVKLDGVSGPLRVRFRNDGHKSYRKAEAHLVYAVQHPGPVIVTFAWKEASGKIRTARHTYDGPPGQEDTSWSIETGKQVTTVWVEYQAP